jgi:hypothetical protein
MYNLPKVNKNLKALYTLLNTENIEENFNYLYIPFFSKKTQMIRILCTSATHGTIIFTKSSNDGLVEIWSKSEIIMCH